MPPRTSDRRPANAHTTFGARALAPASSPGRRTRFLRGQTIFAQGERSTDVHYIHTGAVKLSVCSKARREAVVAMLGPGDFLGEGSLAGQAVRTSTATATAATTVSVIGAADMVQLLHRTHAMSDRFIAYMLSRNVQIEEDLIDQLFNSSEKRLARTLLRLAQYGEGGKPRASVPRVSTDTLAEMVGATRSRVRFFLNKFKKLGFIAHLGRGPITINRSLLTVVLQD